MGTKDELTTESGNLSAAPIPHSELRIPHSIVPHSAIPIRHSTVLIVEDSAVQAELLRRVLEGAGYKVIAAGDGAEGLAMAKMHHPAAVVSDINMPVMDGYAMCHAIRRDEALKATPVILLTMLSDPVDVIRGLNAGADAYVTKPYNVPALVSRIESLLAYPPVPPPTEERRKLEIRLADETHRVDAHGPRMLNLLISTYENAVVQNRELAATQRALEDLNQHLEQKVLEKTAALQASERRFRSLIEHASDLVTVVDAQGKIAYISPSVKRLGGYEIAEVVGTRYLDYAHPEDRPATAAALAELLRAPDKPHVSEFRFRHKNGTWVTLESIARNALDDLTINGIVINSRDITERKRAEEKIVRLNSLYATLSGINTAIVHSTNAAELFDRVCEVAVEQGRFSMAWIGTVDPANQMVTPVAHRGLTPEDLVMIRDSVGRITEGRGPTAAAIRESRTLYTNDYGTERTSTPWHAKVAERGMRGSATLPINQGGETVGVLKLYVRERDFFDGEQLALLEEMRTDISFALDRFASEAKRRQAEAALVESEVRFRALIENASDITAVVSQDGVISYTSPSIKTIAGYDPDELAGSNMAQVIHPDDVQAATGALAESIRVPEEAHRVELRVRMKNGSWRVFDVLARDQRGQAAIGGVIVNMRDISERKRSEDALSESEGKLKAIFDAAADGILLAETETRRFRAANASICRMLGYSQEEMLNLDVSDIHPKDELPHVVHQFERQAKGEITVAVELTMKRKDGSVFFADVNSTPVMLSGKTYVLGVFRDITERKDAEKQRQHDAERLRHSLEETVRAVALTVEMRDPYTAGHQRRVADLAAAIATELGLPDEQIHGLHLAGIIHDLGKIQIPAEILSKPGKLTDIEFSLIKSHPQAGYDILKDVEFPWPIAQIVLQHHERMDGSGYPQGLKAEQILPEARILAVADVIEAMSSHRPYRAGLGLEVTLAEIAKDRGRLYDAAVVDACVKLFREKRFAFST